MGAFVAAAGLLGLLVGWFLNLVIWRVPRGESVLPLVSRCRSCELTIRLVDSVPVLSWLVGRGHCRGCGDRLAARDPLIEFATGAVFAGVALHFGASAVLPAFFYLAAVGLALAVIDIDHHRLPDSLTKPSYVVGTVLLAAAALAEHHERSLLTGFLGAFGLFAGYFLLWLIYPRGLGFGDVKLAGVLGLYLGYLGWQSWLVGVYAGFVLGGLVSLVLLLTRRAGRKTKVPFGPAMVLGTFVGVFAGPTLTAAWLGV